MISKEKLQRGQKTAANAVLLQSCLVLAKAIAGILSGSLVLISDAIHSASDIVSIFTSWFGLKITQRKADQRFPYGYYKAENLGTLVISLFILYAFWGIWNQGWLKLFYLSTIKMPALALSVSLLDALILFFFGGYIMKVGKKINAQSLVAIGKENKTHLFSSLAVFLGILATIYQIPYLEGLSTLAISLLILRIGLSAARDSVFSLMDVSPGKEIENKVIKTIESVSAIEDFYDLRLRRSGPFILGETKVGVRKSIDVKKAHEIADRVEGRIKNMVPHVDSFLVHVEPFKSDWQHLVFPVKEKRGLNSKISPRFARSSYFLFLNLKKKKIKGFYFLENPYKNLKTKAGLSVAKLISEQKSDALITQEIGEIAFYTLKDRLFNIYQAEPKTIKQGQGPMTNKKGQVTVKKCLNSYLRNQISELKQPTKSV